MSVISSASAQLLTRLYSFLLFTRDEQVDIEITHGADKGPGQGDCSGTATATFGKVSTDLERHRPVLGSSLIVADALAGDVHQPMRPGKSFEQFEDIQKVQS